MIICRDVGGRSGILRARYEALDASVCMTKVTIGCSNTACVGQQLRYRNGPTGRSAARARYLNFSGHVIFKIRLRVASSYEWKRLLRASVDESKLLRYGLPSFVFDPRHTLREEANQLQQTHSNPLSHHHVHLHIMPSRIRVGRRTTRAFRNRLAPLQHEASGRKLASCRRRFLQ